MLEHHEWKTESFHARFEPPAVLWLKLQGPLSLDDAKRIVSICRALGDQQAFFVMADMRENTGIDQEGRRYASEHMNPEWFEGIIYTRARLIHKAAAKGINLVQRMLGRATAPIYFASTEEEARALLAQLRRARQPGSFNGQ